MAAGDKKYDALNRENAPEIYRLIEDLVKKHHASDLADARIGAMYVYDVPEDRDGKTWWGKAKLVSKKDQEYHPHDFVIELNFQAWQALLPKQRVALMDHELCHCARAEAEDGSSTFYIRKHDLEEFHEIVERHGVKWRPAAEEFVRRATGQVEPTLFDGPPKVTKVTLITPDGASVTTTAEGLANAVKESRRAAAADRRSAAAGR